MFHLINRFRFLFLFILLFLFCLFKAIHIQLGWLGISDLVFGLLIISSLLIIGHKENLLITLFAMIMFLMMLLHGLSYYLDKPTVTALRSLVIVVFLILTTCYCLYFTAQDQTISITTLFGSISAYFFLGLIFAYLYSFIELISPHSFSNLDPYNEAQDIYFSFISLTTVGYGEIVPIKPISQTFVWFEAFCGQVYLAVIIGQMVGRYVAAEGIKNKSG